MSRAWGSPKQPEFSVTMWSLIVALGCLSVYYYLAEKLVLTCISHRFISFGGEGRGSCVTESS